MHRLTACGIVLAVCLGACTSVASDLSTPTATPVISSTDVAATPTTAPIGIPGRALTVWVPPRFSPDGPDEAATLLAEGLLEFEANHPGVRIEVRVKGQSGPASLMVALAAAQQAAPSVLPDLVALDGTDLATAHASGLIAAWEEIGTTPEMWDWIISVADGARSNSVLIGLPFAAQADVFAYRPVAYPTPPRSWADTLTGSGSFLFPAGDPRSEFTLAQYLSAGGTLRDAEGDPALDAQALQDVLEFYSAARAGGLLPLSSRQHEDSSTTIEALTSGQVGAAVVPFDRLAELQALEIGVMGPWPSRDGNGTCFVNPWSWAVVDRPSSPDPLAIELATWLARPEFAGPWTHALNLLPATSSALALWP
ncbi:MAG: ABC transporter substrate-binding protein, partial [Chloroflexi bacterium]|nr:ABC transporter substrate-binding protein [Chloroflexota bacterium]